LTHQKGIHVFFETDLVDALYDGVGAPAHELSADVARVASELIKREHKSEPISEKPALYVDDWPIIRKLSQQSVDELPKLLKIDREVSRKSLEAAAKANRDLITARLAAGAVALAEIWRDSLDWKYNGRKFYDFAGAPEYIRAPDVLTAPESH
jgi:hypothetical protein